MLPLKHVPPLYPTQALSLEAQQRYFSYRTVLVAMVLQNSFVFVFVSGFRRRVVSKRVVLADVPLYQNFLRKVFPCSATLAEKAISLDIPVLASPTKCRAIWGIAAIVSQSSWFASLDPHRWQFGIASARIASQNAARVRIAGISHFSILRCTSILRIASQHPKIFTEVFCDSRSSQGDFASLAQNFFASLAIWVFPIRIASHIAVASRDLGH